MQSRRKRRQLTRKQCLEKRDLLPQWEPVPEWAPAPGEADYVEPTEGEEPEEYGVHVRPLASWERAELREQIAAAERRKPAGQEDPQFLQELILIWGVCDESGQPLFSLKGEKGDKGDLKALSQKSNAPIVRLANRVLYLSGMVPAAQAEMEKNSGKIQTSSSGSSWATDMGSPTTDDSNGRLAPEGSPC